jgi:Na+-driven multidrug efflux pump
MALIQQLTIYRLIAVHGGVQETALFGAAFRLFFVITLPTVGMQRALQPIVGQNFGAERYDRVRKALGAFLATMLGMSLVLWAGSFLAPEAILSLLLPKRVFTAAEIANFRLFISVTAFLPVPFVAITYFPSIGNGGLPAVLALARQVVVFIPAAIILAATMGVAGIYQALFWTDVLVGVVSAVLLALSVRKLGGSVTPAAATAGP